MNLESLDFQNVRELMIQELDEDIDNSNIYLSNRLIPTSHQKYQDLFKDACQSGNPNTFAMNIQSNRCLKTTETSRSRSGNIINKKVPYNAHETLAEGEFNRFYLRGLCLKAIELGNRIEVYRAKPVMNPRSRSQAMIGKKIDPQQILHDLRTHIGVDAALGLPPGPNSGLSGRLCE